MGFLLHKKAVDDSCLVDRRTRSTSPSKNRHSLPPNFFDMRLPHMPIAKDEDLRSATSSSSSSKSQEHLKQLSKSPVSRRLHVTTHGTRDGGYVIPIPFTLSLPPKLSQKNIERDASKRSHSASPVRSKDSRHSSPTRSEPRAASMSPRRRQTKLVYTGSGYSKLDSSSDDELSEDDIKKKIAFNRRPPPLPAKKRRSSKTIYQQKSDELSIIEEASNSGASRTSSVKSKASATSSAPPPPIEKDPKALKLRAPPAKPAPVPQPAAAAAASRSATAPVTSQAKPNVRVMTVPSPRQVHPAMPKTKNEFDLRTLQMQGPPGKGGNLRISKRSFSDESYVSSISSFSSVGDVMSINKSPIQYRTVESSPVLRRLNDQRGIQTRPKERTVSASSALSRSSDGSVASWNSVQSSINIKSGSKSSLSAARVTRKISLKPKMKSKQLPPIPPSDDEWEDECSDEEELQDDESDKAKDVFEKDGISSASITEPEDEEEDSSLSIKQIAAAPSMQPKLVLSEEPEEVKPLRISRASTMTDSHELAAPHKFQRSDDEHTSYDYYLDDIASISTAMYSELTVSPEGKQRTPDYDNRGAGRRFSFPNNRRNVTNSRAAQLRKVSANSNRSNKSRNSFMSKEGQIEIPDLDNLAPSSKDSYYSYNTKSANESEADTSGSAATGTDDDVSQLEPIGYPSKAAQNVKEHFKSMYSDDDDSDTDIESTKFSLYAHHQRAKSTPNLTANRNKDLPPIEGLRSPAAAPRNTSLASSPKRHQRHKSQHTINFGDLMLPLPKANRSEETEQHTFKSATPSSKSPEANEDNSPESLQIVIAEPPSQIRYEVDFKEAAVDEGYQPYQAQPDYMNDIYRRSATVHSFSRDQIGNVTNQMNGLSLGRRNSRPHAVNRSLEEASYTSRSSFRTSASAKPSTMTSITDNESVVIDLTKDNYDICMVNREDSIQSYRSVTEKTKDGKEVEVVLVDEDEDDDDLLSLYSKYRNDSWVFRSNSTSSRSSDGSVGSFDSNTPSETQISLKKPQMAKHLMSSNSLRVPGTLVHDLSRKRSNLSASSNGSANYNSRRIQPPQLGQSKSIKRSEPVYEKPTARPSYTESNKRHTIPTMDSNYFDYTSGDKYDFNTFMRQQTTNQI